MVVYTHDSNIIADHPWIPIVAVFIGVLFCLCRIACSTSSDDSDELPPVQVVPVASPEHVYPNHAIDVQQGYVAMAPTPSLSQPPQAIQVVPAYAIYEATVSSQSNNTSA